MNTSSVGGLSKDASELIVGPPAVGGRAGRDSNGHTASASAGSFDSGNLNPGQRFSFTFHTPGNYPYVCQ